MPTTDQLNFIIIGNSQSGQDAVKKVNQEFGNTEKKIGGMKSALNNFKQNWIGITAAISGSVLIGKKAIDSYSKQENAIKKLEAILKSTKNAVGFTSKELQTMASGLQAVTIHGDEAIIEAESLLLTFTKIGHDIFPQVTETVLNMSDAFGIDLRSASIQLGKALQDPIQGVTALRRVGITFSEDQKKVIDRLVETNDLAGAQKIILGELETQTGGVARAMSEGGAGAIAQFKNAYSDMMEVVGSSIVGFLKPIVINLKDLAIGFQGLPNPIKNMAAAIMVLTPAVFALNAAIGPLGLAITGVVAALTIGAIKFKQWNDEVKRLESIKDTSQTFKTLYSDIEKLGDQLLRATGAKEGYVEISKEFTSNQKAETVDTKAFIDQLNYLENAIKNTGNMQSMLNDSIDIGNSMMEENYNNIDFTNSKQKDNIEITKLDTVEKNTLLEMIQKLRDAYNEKTAAIKNSTDAIENQKTKEIEYYQFIGDQRQIDILQEEERYNKIKLLSDLSNAERETAQRQHIENMSEIDKKYMIDLLDGFNETKEAIEEQKTFFSDAYIAIQSATGTFVDTFINSFEDVNLTFGKLMENMIVGFFDMLSNTLAGEASKNIALAIASLLSPFTAALAPGYFAAGGSLMGAAASIKAGIAIHKAGSIKAAAYGADFTTSGPQMMLVGDNPSGRERVTVTPEEQSPIVQSGITIQQMTIVTDNPMTFAENMRKLKIFAGARAFA